MLCTGIKHLVLRSDLTCDTLRKVNNPLLTFLALKNSNNMIKKLKNDNITYSDDAEID